MEIGARKAALLADSFTAKRFTRVVDDVVLRLLLTHCRDALSCRPLLLVARAPAMVVALERDRQRTEKHVAARFPRLDEELRTQLLGLGLWLHTSVMGIAETVEAILQQTGNALPGSLFRPAHAQNHELGLRRLAPIFAGGAIGVCLQEALEAGAALGDCLGIQASGDVFRNPSRIDSII